MISEEEALRQILQSALPLPSERVTLLAAAGRFAGEDVIAQAPLPGFDNSSMDGYAVRAADCTPDARLHLTGVQPAGRVQHLAALRKGEAVRIFTGASIPPGADAVIMQEDVREENGSILIGGEAVESGENIRRAGIDVCAGQKILSAGERITPQRIALLAAQGASTIDVGTMAEAAILSTGDELTPPGELLEPGTIYDSNGPMLAALVAQVGAKGSSVEKVHDESSALGAALKRGLDHDVLLISGGVSVGARDLVKQKLRDLGAACDIWRVAVKPGKPFLFARTDRCLVFGLPGNPVSAFVTFHLFVRPALLQMMGAAEPELAPRTMKAVTDSELANPGERPHYVRGVLAGGIFSAFGRQESHAVFGLGRSNALVRVPAGATVPRGSEVTARTLD